MTSRPPDPSPADPPPPTGGGPAGGGAPTLGEVMQLPDPMRSLVLWLLRHGEAGLPELTAASGLEEGPCRDLLAALVARGHLYTTGGDGAARYRTRLTPRRPRPASTDIWERLKG